MKPIKQKFSNDCGLACIATITGTDYKKIINTLNLLPLPYAKRRNQNDKDYLTDFVDLCLLLNKFGYNASVKEIKSLKALRAKKDLKMAILNVRSSQTYRTGVNHWVVYENTKKEIHDPDPQVKHPVRDFRKYRLCGSRQYIEID